MTQEDRERLRATFDQAAELYERARPGYPPALFDDLAGLAGMGPGSRVLEIGPGTGQATLPLAERGCRVMAVELGPDLATRVGGRRPQLQQGARPVRPVRSRDVPGTGRLGLGCRR
jgi:protein-L-isoaspartate O-methyltransferase